MQSRASSKSVTLGGSKVRIARLADRWVNRSHVVAKFRNKKVPPGGWSNVSIVLFDRTGGPLTRRFFSGAWRFWTFKRNQRNQKPNHFKGRCQPHSFGARFIFRRTGGRGSNLWDLSIRDRWGRAAHLFVKLRKLFSALPEGEGDQNSGTFRSRTGGQAEKKGRKMARFIFCSRPRFRNSFGAHRFRKIAAKFRVGG